MGRFSALQRLDVGFDRRLTVGSPSVRYVSWEYTGCVFSYISKCICKFVRYRGLAGILSNHMIITC